MTGEIVNSDLKTEQQLLMEKVFETKLTRNELFDLIIDSLEKDIEAKLAPLRAERDAIKFPTLTEAEALEMLTGAKERQFVTDTGNTYSFKGTAKDNEMWVKFGAIVPKSALPTRFTEEQKFASSEHKRLTKKIEPLEQELRKISGGKSQARLAILTQVLESTDVGVKVLKAIESAKVQVRQKILAP